MSSSAKRYTKSEEARMRAAGLRPVTIWVPDVTNPASAAEYRRQAELAVKAEAGDASIDSFLEAAWREMDEEASE